MSERKRSAQSAEDDWDTTVYVQHTDQPATAQDNGVSRIHRPPPEVEDVFEDEPDDDDIDMTVAELLYSTSSFYAIVIPGMYYETFRRAFRLYSVP